MSYVIQYYILSEGWDMSLIYDGAVPFQFLKTVVAMQDSTLWELWTQFIFLKWAASVWELEAKSKQRRLHLFCAVWSLCFRFLLRRGSHDV